MKVLVTRPVAQTEAFVLLLKQAGLEFDVLPCIGIRQLALTEKDFRVGDFGAVVFTSTNAVNGVNEYYPLPWKTGKTGILAIGPTTAALLEEYGQNVTEEPKAPYNSEALLKSATLSQADLKRVAIIKGVGGRGYLEKSLQNRGLEVNTLDTYERYLPDIAQSELERVFLNSPVDIVTITSNEILMNLTMLAGGHYREQLLGLPLVVSSSRAADLAQELGFRNTIAVARTPGNLGLVNAIKRWKLSRDGI